MSSARKPQPSEKGQQKKAALKKDEDSDDDSESSDNPLDNETVGDATVRNVEASLLSSGFQQSLYDDGTGTRPMHASAIQYSVKIMQSYPEIAKQVRKKLRPTNLSQVYIRLEDPCQDDMEKVNAKRRAELEEQLLALNQIEEKRAAELERLTRAQERLPQLGQKEQPKQEWKRAPPGTMQLFVQKMQEYQQQQER
jgi:hypothetical protein